MRLLILALFAFALARPEIKNNSQQLDLYVLLDRSESTETLVEQGYEEWKSLLNKAKPTKDDQLHFVDYATYVSPQIPGTETATYQGDRKLTRTRLALENILATRNESRPSRVLLFTDGYSTEPLYQVSEKLIKAGVPVDFRLVRDKEFHDYYVAKLDVPSQAQQNEPFIMNVTVRGPEDGPVALKVFKNGTAISKEASVNLINGIGSTQFTARVADVGAHEIAVQIAPEKDAHAGNNYLSKWVQVTGGPKIMLVTNHPDDPVATVLRQQDYNVQLVTDSNQLKVGMLTGCKSVIFNNVPAYEVPQDFLNALDFYVHEQGGGFLMIGGKHSFGGGGYAQSAIDDLLPVSMELKNDHRKTAVSLAIVMDRSGSMAMTVPSGGGAITKMQLANNGAAEAIKLMGATDEISLFAVDSSPYTIIQRQQIKGNQNQLISKAKRVQSQGGGIYVYTGLKAAWKQLKHSNIGTKHIILFSDASDTEEPGGYKALLAEMVKEGASVSVIGLGSKSDVDARLLEDIAKRGKGRVFFTNKPLDLPKLFAQETITLARSAFLTDPTAALTSGEWSDISASPLSWLRSVDAYNLSYLRPGATSSLVSGDEYKAPLVAHWRRGLGRVAAVSFPLSGEHSAASRNWTDYGNFTQTLINWLNGDKFPPGISLRQNLNGTQLTLDLLYDTEDEALNWSEKLAASPPQIRITEDNDLSYELPWKRIAPGHFSMSVELPEGKIIRGAIRVGAHAISFGPLALGSGTEWHFDRSRLEELRELTKQTNGRELLDISNAWVRPETTVSQSLVYPIAIVLLLLVLAEAFLFRVGYQIPWKKALALIPAKQTKSKAIITSKETTRQTQQKKKQPKRKHLTPQEPTTTATPITKPQEKPTQSRQARFARAKKRK